ncbi:tetratricopeptide repeat protein [Streptomyces purpureus]|uniref:tetratricopeptide repeat protein n=1 Tax=Streptomyces purpureus TaxID=1951 RepID=UPI0037BDBA1A
MKSAMKTETVTRTVLVSVAGAVLVGSALMFVPGMVQDVPAPAPGPAARAMTAVASGAQATLPDLAALIDDREKWLSKHPKDEESWAVLGAAYTERGTRVGEPASFRRAEWALRRSLAALPAEEGNVDAQVGLGALANARGDYMTAWRWGEQARRLKPKRWTAYPVLFEAYNGLGNYKAAREAVEQLGKLRTGSPVLARTAQSYRDRGWREDAAATAAEAVARAATPAEKAACLHRLGELAWERGDLAEAVDNYDAALRLLPGHGPSLAGRARALGALGRTDEAFRDYEAALRALPLASYALESGELYESLGLDTDAQERYAVLHDRQRRGNPGGADDTLVLGRFEADHGDPEAAVVRLRTLWAKHRSVEVADALGWALLKAGEPRQALEFAKRATESGVRSALFTYHRGEVERALGEYGAARRHIGEALRINPHFSPLLAPRAKESLSSLGDPPEGGPRQMYPKPPATERQSARETGKPPGQRRGSVEPPSGRTAGPRTASSPSSASGSTPRASTSGAGWTSGTGSSSASASSAGAASSSTSSASSASTRTD